MAERVRGVRAIAEALGMPSTSAHRLIKDGVIVVGVDGTWDVDGCRIAVAEHRRRKLPATTLGAPQAPPSAAPAPARSFPALAPPRTANELLAGRGPPVERGEDLDEDQLKARLRQSADPLEVAQLAARLAALRYSKSLDDENAKILHGSLETWRKMENDALELSRKRGQVIDRDVAKACIGAYGQRFKLACERFGVRLASQLELWHSDERLWSLPAEERARVVREWADAQTSQARLAEMAPEAKAQVERMVADEIAKRVRVKKGKATA